MYNTTNEEKEDHPAGYRMQCDAARPGASWLLPEMSEFRTCTFHILKIAIGLDET